MLLGAWLMSVGDQRSVILPWLKLPLPETCTARMQFGIDCPGCGLTRSFIHLAHGNLADAWQLQPLSFAIFAYAVFQIPLAILHLRHVQPDWLATSTRWNSIILIALVLALGLRWVWRLLAGDLF